MCLNRLKIFFEKVSQIRGGGRTKQKNDPQEKKKNPNFNLLKNNKK